MNFGEAIEAIKKGSLVIREKWNNECTFIFMRPEDNLSFNFVINNIESLPKSLKDYYKQLVDLSISDDNRVFTNNRQITFAPCICMKITDEYIINGWIASQEDILATDWEVIWP